MVLHKVLETFVSFRPSDLNFMTSFRTLFQSKYKPECSGCFALVLSCSLSTTAVLWLEHRGVFWSLASIWSSPGELAVLVPRDTVFWFYVTFFRYTRHLMAVRLHWALWVRTFWMMFSWFITCSRAARFVLRASFSCRMLSTCSWLTALWLATCSTSAPQAGGSRENGTDRTNQNRQKPERRTEDDQFK